MTSNSTSEYKVVADVIVSPDEDIVVYVEGDIYKGTIEEQNRYLTASDPKPVRWSPIFSATGLTFTGSNSTYPTYNSYYVKLGKLVSFYINVDCTTVTSFGTGQFKVELPFAAPSGIANHFSGWVWVNPALPPDDLNGHIIVTADHLPGSQTLDLHWNKAATSNPKPVIESIFEQGSPVTLTTASKIQISGTYICN